MKTIIEFIKEDPKEFIEGLIGFASLFAICFMIAGIGA